MDQPGSLNSGHASLDDWLAWLETLSPVDIKLGLDRVLEVLDRLHPARPGRVIHVAGTNGKGSSVAMLESLFMELGERVGTYTSPHVHRYNERIRIDAEPVGDKEIISAFERIEAARQGLPLTYFEYGTVAAILIFDAIQADIVILEVGMGGRLDAVNAIEPDAGIITNVSLDHCAWLGDDIESIAAEKAGILRSGKPFIFGAAEAPDSILAAAADLGTDLCVLDTDFEYSPESDHTWGWSGRRTKLTNLRMPALAGNFQCQNAAAVLALVEALQLDVLLDRELINGAFDRLELAGRCQMIQSNRRWLLDVAHNPDAASVLGCYLSGLGESGRTVTIIGMLEDKDLPGIVSPLLGCVDAWLAVTADAKQALPARALAAEIANLSDKPCLVADSLPDAMRHAGDQTTSEDLILVTGSFYVVGPALEWLGE